MRGGFWLRRRFSPVRGVFSVLACVRHTRSRAILPLYYRSWVTTLYQLDPTTGSGIEAIHRAGADDALLGLGFAPYSSATIELVQLASRRNVAIVAITDSRASPLVHLARKSIIVPDKFAVLLPEYGSRTFGDRNPGCSGC